MQHTDTSDSTVELRGELRPFTHSVRCPVCAGYAGNASGTECEGHFSGDGGRAFCTNEFRSVQVTAPPISHVEMNDAETLISSPELFRQPDPSDWLVEERLPPRGTSMLIGAPQTGKTELARDLAISVSRGVPWLGCSTERGSVLYVSLAETSTACAAKTTSTSWV